MQPRKPVWQQTVPAIPVDSGSNCTFVVNRHANPKGFIPNRNTCGMWPTDAAHPHQGMPPIAEQASRAIIHQLSSIQVALKALLSFTPARKPWNSL